MRRTWMTPQLFQDFLNAGERMRSHDWKIKITGLRNFLQAKIQLALEEDAHQMTVFQETTNGFLQILNNQADGVRSIIQFEEGLERNIKLFQDNVIQF